MADRMTVYSCVKCGNGVYKSQLVFKDGKCYHWACQNQKSQEANEPDHRERADELQPVSGKADAAVVPGAVSAGPVSGENQEGGGAGRDSVGDPGRGRQQRPVEHRGKEQSPSVPKPLAKAPDGGGGRAGKDKRSR